MQLDFAELAVRLFKDGKLDIQEIASIFNQCATVTAKVTKVEEVASSGGGLVHENPWRLSKEIYLSYKIVKIRVSRAA